MCLEKQSRELAQGKQYVKISSFWTIIVISKCTKKTTPLLRNNLGVNLLVSKEQDQGGNKTHLQQKQT